VFLIVYNHPTFAPYPNGAAIITDKIDGIQADVFRFSTVNHPRFGMENNWNGTGVAVRPTTLLVSTRNLMIQYLSQKSNHYDPSVASQTTAYT